MRKRDLLWIPIFFSIFLFNMWLNPIMQDSKKRLEETERILQDIKRHAKTESQSMNGGTQQEIP